MDSRRLALIIATGEYCDPTLSALRSPASDAIALQRVLSDPHIGNYEVEVLTDQPKAVVERAIERVFTSADLDDQVLLHLSGHGFRTASGRWYMPVRDSQLDYLNSTAVSARFIVDLIEGSRCRRTVLLLDCCFSGAFVPGLAAKSAASVNLSATVDEGGLAGKGRAVLTASSRLEYAFEGNDIKREDATESFFTAAVVEALESGQADRNRDGHITPQELYDFVYDRVRARTPSQTPTLSTSGIEGQLVVAFNRTSRAVFRWNSETGTCDGPRAASVLPGRWLVSAPRHPPAVRTGLVVQLGLMRGDAPPASAVTVYATVTAPNGASARASTVLYGDRTSYLLYPSDFPGAKPIEVEGSYTVLWESEEGYLSCDGFLVSNQYAFDAPEGADHGLEEYQEQLRVFLRHRERSDSDSPGFLSDLRSLLVKREHSRQSLTRTYGVWVGDQHLHGVELGTGLNIVALNTLSEMEDKELNKLSPGQVRQLRETLFTV